MNVRFAPVLVAVAVGLAFRCAAPPPPCPVLAAAPASAPSLSPALAPRNRGPFAAWEPVKDVYHAVEVEDPYRWLEETSSDRVKAFAMAQNDWARKYLDALPD